MKKRISLAVVAVLLGLLILFCLKLSVFIVKEGERGLLISSKPSSTFLMPGLHFKWPWQSIATLQLQNLSSIEVPSSANESLQFTVLWSLNDTHSVSAMQEIGELPLLLKSKFLSFLTPAVLSNNNLQKVSAMLENALQNDSDLQQKGITVQQIWLKGITPNAAMQSKIFNNMQGLAATIGQSIVASGTKQAEQIRSEAEEDFLNAQKQALQEAAAVVGQGNSEAVKTMVPLYHAHPVLFKAYVTAKLRLLASS